MNTLDSSLELLRDMLADVLLQTPLTTYLILGLFSREVPAIFLRCPSCPICIPGAFLILTLLPIILHFLLIVSGIVLPFLAASSVVKWDGAQAGGIR
jgi:hypothetical protein